MSRIPLSLHQKLPNRIPVEYRFSNYALRLNRVNQQYVSCGFAGFNVNAGTFGIWAKMDNYASGVREVLIDAWGDASNRIYLYHSAANNMDAVHAGSGVFRWISIPVASYRGLHFWAFTWDSVADEIRSFVDGLQFGAPVGGLGAFAGALTELSVGRQQIFDYWKGLATEFFVRDRALTPYEIWECYLRGYARLTGDSVLNLRFEEGLGLTAYDDSPNVNNGTLLPALTPPTWERTSLYELLAESGV